MKLAEKLAMVTGMTAFAAVVWAAPQPDFAPTSWQLDVEFEDLQQISVQAPGESHPSTYWYVLYTVTNEADQDVPFYPSSALVTDSLKVINGGDNIPPTVYEAIKARHRINYPFLKEPAKATGKLLQGLDNKRTSVAVFRDFDPESNKATVYLGGFSGEIERMKNPSFDADKPIDEDNQPTFLLRKTLAIEYSIPGDASSRNQSSPTRLSREWVMR